MINHGADHASTIYIGRGLRGLAERNMDGTAGIGGGKGLGGPSPWDKGRKTSRQRDAVVRRSRLF